MKVLLIHNRYVFRGGEDSVMEREAELLRSHGHEVECFLRDNREIGDGDSRLALAVNTIWSRSGFKDALSAMRDFAPDVVHVHNTLPRISPSVYYAAKQAGVPVVQTLHNYRMHCVSGLLLRDGQVCEDCVGKLIPFPAVQHACYRGSRAATAAVGAMYAIHKIAGTYSHHIARYIALSNFSREKLLSAGLPADRVVIKPNFAFDSGCPDPALRRNGGLYVGRLSEEKGVGVLERAWRRLPYPIRVTSDGPLASLLQKHADRIEMVGFVDEKRISALMREAAYLVAPSITYEGFPMVIAEAFAAGLPVIASRLGALGELVEDGVTGLHFKAGDSDDLADKVRWAETHPEEMRAMGRRARGVYEARYTPEKNYGRLIEIYNEARNLRPATGRRAEFEEERWSST